MRLLVQGPGTDLNTRVEECEREKRNAVVWEREQRLSERELNSLRSSAVSVPPALRLAGNLLTFSPQGIYPLCLHHC